LSIGNGRIGFVLSDSGHLLRVFNNLVALLGIPNLRKVSGRLLQGLQQLVRLPRLPLGLGGTGPGMIGASGVFLLRLPVELQRPAQLALVLGFLAHQVDLGAVAGGEAGVALIRGDFYELAVIELVAAQGVLLGGKQGLEQQQALGLALSILDFGLWIWDAILHVRSVLGVAGSLC